MSNTEPCAPVIIIGMHRSGTSLVTRLLERLGLFVGKKKESNHESVFFLRLNEWMLYQSGGAWDRPAAIHDLIKDSDTRDLVERYLDLVMSSPRAISYLGLRRYVRYNSIANIKEPWGWKDPRNTYTLPIWLDLFPQAKIIHIYRHGVDVANSLKVRGKVTLNRAHKVFRYRKFIYRFLQKKGGFSESVRCATLEGGLSLWEEYVAEARRHVHHLGNQAIEIKYEDFVTHPIDTLRTLCVFSGLEPDDTQIQEAAANVNASRAYAYLKNQELKDFADAAAGRLKIHGY